MKQIENEEMNNFFIIKSPPEGTTFKERMALSTRESTDVPGTL